MAVKGEQFLLNHKPFYLLALVVMKMRICAAKDSITCYGARSRINGLDWGQLLPYLAYPYAEEMLDWADEHGIVVIEKLQLSALTSL